MPAKHFSATGDTHFYEPSPLRWRQCGSGIRVRAGHSTFSKKAGPDGAAMNIATLLHHFDGISSRRGAPVDLCAGVVTAAFIKRRRIDVNYL
jgi:hypothetical protein